MKASMIIITAAAAGWRGACGTTTHRTASDGGIGVFGGPPGVGAGAIAGGAIGGLTNHNQITLGPPIFNRHG
jgi:hypothetical protein